MTAEEKQMLRREIPKYIKEHCYYTDGTIKCYDLWLVGWVAAEFINPKNAMKVLIKNEYGLLGNLLHKLARTPDASITRLIERTDLDILLKAIKAAGSQRVLSRNKLSSDLYAMRLLIKHDIAYAREVDHCVLGSKPLLLAVVECCPDMLQTVSPALFRDEKFTLSLIKKNYACMKYLPHKYCNDYRFCLEAARQDGYSMMYFFPEMREHDEIVLAAVSSRGNSLSLALSRQKKDRNIVYAAVKNCGFSLDYADDTYKRDFEIVATAVSNRGMALRFAAPELQDNEDIVRLAVENDGYALRFASERLRNNRELAMLAISSYPDAYEYLSPKLKSDIEIITLYAQKKEEEPTWHPSKTQ